MGWICAISTDWKQPSGLGEGDELHVHRPLVLSTSHVTTST